MKTEQAISIASAFLSRMRIPHCPPVDVRESPGGDVEVIFTCPEALSLDVVVDPPDVRVRICAKTQQTELLPDM